MGGQWQIYVQAAAEGDFGGTACWMGQNIGKMSGNHPAGSYSDQQWLDELDRLNHDPDSGHTFAPGDLVEIRARAPGLSFRGKTNVNEQHNNVPELDFDVVLLEAEYGLPAPTMLTLADLKDAGDQFLFDAARVTGPEHCQGSLVRINEIELVDPLDWAANADLTITDGEGRTLPIKLPLAQGYDDYPAPSEPFDIIGILDQEDLDGADGNKDGYRLWVMADYDGNDQTVPPTGAMLYDLNYDGFPSIVGDVIPFVDCVYFNDCQCRGLGGCQEPGDCNCDGFLSIVGDVPCFVDCVYFDQCESCGGRSVDQSEPVGDWFTIGGVVYRDPTQPLLSGVQGLKVRVLDTVGRVIATARTEGPYGLWSVDELAAGSYTVSYHDGKSVTIEVSAEHQAANQSLTHLHQERNRRRSATMNSIPPVAILK